MIEAPVFVEALRASGIRRATGVPCSYMKALVSYSAASGDFPYYAASSEGEAVAIACGSALAGEMAAVMIQNSGLGNCVNPLTSLATTYEIPLLLLVSHRGEGGDDAPQHRLMGHITSPLLELMEIPVRPLPREWPDAESVIRDAVRDAVEHSRPSAVIVPKGAFAPFPYEESPGEEGRPTAAVERSGHPAEVPDRAGALAAIAAAVPPDEAIVATTGMTGRELYAVADRPGNFYMVGSMGCAPGLGFGAAVVAPDQGVTVVDGDGAFLMKMGTAGTIGHYRPPNLTHVLLDNGSYETTGGQPTASPSVDFCNIAAAAGYERVIGAASIAELAEVLGETGPGAGPVFVHLRIASGRLPEVPRVPEPLQELRDRFSRFLVSRAATV